MKKATLTKGSPSEVARNAAPACVLAARGAVECQTLVIRKYSEASVLDQLEIAQEQSHGKPSMIKVDSYGLALS